MRDAWNSILVSASVCVCVCVCVCDVLCREHAEIARKIFNLTSEQFDLLQSGPSTAPGTQNGTGPALEELRAAIHSKIQVW